MRKGFTLVELLGVIAILAILAIIGIPVYGNIRNSVNKSVYESKVKNVESGAESYAEETGSTVLYVQDLINSGKIEADNEMGIYMDPLKNRDMKCDIINVKYEDNQYVAALQSNDDCSINLQSVYGMASIKLYSNENLSGDPTVNDTDWLHTTPIYASYVMNDDYKDDKITNITWNGNGEKNCTEENINDCKTYKVETTNLINQEITMRITVQINSDGALATNTITKQIKVDFQNPYVNNVSYSDEVTTNQNRKVSFSLSDGEGSGIKAYGISTTNDCTNVTWKNVSDSQVDEYLASGTYYICAQDKVGNINTVDNRNDNRIDINNVISGTPNIQSFTITSRDSYSSPNIWVNLSLSEARTGLKMCISDSGFEKNCTYQSYTSTNNDNRNWQIPFNLSNTSLDGSTRTLYISIEDAANNKINRTSSYVIYQECSAKTKRNTQSDWNACTDTCGWTGTQTKPYEVRDNYTNKLCESGNDVQACNRRDCCSSKYMSSRDGDSACNKACDTGTKTYVAHYTSSYKAGYSCGAETLTEYCNTQGCCSSTYLDHSDSSCNAYCGSGTNTINEYYYSNYTHQYCSTNTRYEGCSASCPSDDDDDDDGGGSGVAEGSMADADYQSENSTSWTNP